MYKILIETNKGIETIFSLTSLQISTLQTVLIRYNIKHHVMPMKSDN